GRIGMKLKRAELALDDERARPDIRPFQDSIGQRLNVEAGRDFNDLGGHARARQRAPHPGRGIGQRLRLQLIDEDESAEICHGLPRVNSRSSWTMIWRSTSRSTPPAFAAGAGAKEGAGRR